MAVTVLPVVDKSQLDSRGLSSTEQIIEQTINKAEFVGDTIITGGPTLCNYSRALISNTATEFAALSRDHACDISKKIKAKQSLKTGLIAEAIAAIREGIEALLKGESVSTIVTWAASELRGLVKRLKELKRFIEKIQNMVDAIGYYVKFAAEMVQWIMSLPAQLITLMKDCLTDFLKGIGSLLAETFSGSTGISADYKEFEAAYKDLKTSYQAVVSATDSVISTAVSTLNTASYNSLNVNAPSVKQLTTVKSPI